MSDITSQLAQMPSEQREELLKRLLREKARQQIRRYEISFAQQRLWILNQLDPGSPVYNVPSAFWLCGPLDVEAFERSFGEVIRRHELLRSTFEANDETGKPEQLVHPWKPFHLEVLDLTSTPDAEREQEAERLANQEAQRAFDLSEGPLLRARLLKIEPEKHVLLVTLHHIVSDMWSTGILTGEVVTLYEAFSQGHKSPLHDLPLQYADFAHWQRTRVTGEAMERQSAYWREQLKGPLPALELPMRGPRPSINSARGAERAFKLGAEITEALKGLSQQQSSTLFMTLMAAFNALLYRYSGQKDILVGTPIANRNRREFEALIGLFINTLVIRTDLSGEPTFRQLMERVKEVALEAFANQDVPFDKLVEELQPERNLSRAPIFQVMFALQNAPQQEARTRQLSIAPFPLEAVTAKFDLTLTMLETREGLIGACEFNTDLFDDSMIEQMIRHFDNILSSASSLPDQPISLLPLLSHSDIFHLLNSPSPASFSHFFSHLSLHQLFEAHALASPDSIALVFDDSFISYSFLNSCSNKLAHFLIAHSLPPRSLVALFCHRSFDLVISALAILKAGAAYLPLDPAYPADRIRFVLDDARVSFILSHSQLLPALPVSDTSIFCLDSDWHLIDHFPSFNTSISSLDIDPAYVIYTSGSTGKPKGVIVSHNNVTRLFEATHHHFLFDSCDVWSMFHSFAFDFSVWELWGALLFGAKLVIVPYLVSRSPIDFFHLLRSHQVSVLNQTPSAFRQLSAVDELHSSHDLSSLRLVIFGGEALDLHSLKPWFDRHGDIAPQLVNMYGITETTVHVTYRPLSAEDCLAPGASLIGEPLADLKLYALDHFQQLVPVGVVAELYVGGDGVADGYLNRPELTAQRFVPDPFSERLGSRLYRTGDLGRRLANSDMEYRGRIDDQVKIRGFRIELGEIEAALREQAGVKEALVVATEVAQSDRQLVAYVVADDGEELSASQMSAAQLRAALKSKLPEYMVPAAIVMMEVMPLTENGKIDRRALPAPGEARPDLKSAFALPATPAEEVLAAAWSEVLGLKQVGVDDNFFELGGDSIRSIQVLTKTQKRGVSFSLQQLFQYQTIRELAHEIAAADGFAPDKLEERHPFSLISDEDRSRLPADAEDAYPLTLLQEGMLFHSDYDPAAAVYHNVGTYFLKAPLDVEIIDKAIEQLLARHAVLRTSFDLANFSEPLQLVHRNAPVLLGVEDISHLSPSEQEEALTQWEESEKRLQFDWRSAPLIRFRIHRRSDKTFQFSMTEHHAILDGWSVASILTELFKSYFSMLNRESDYFEGPQSNLFREFVYLERQALRSEECQRFWTEKLADATVTTLPLWPSSYRKAEPSQNHVVDARISLEAAEKLRQLAHSISVPLRSVLLAAHIKVMSFISGQPDVITGVVTHGRPEDAGGERAAGLFLNTLPFRLKISEGNWNDFARAVFDAEREMMPFRYYPLAQIQRDHGGQALFETVFNFTNFHVFETLREFDELEILNAKLYAETNLPFWANFSLDARSQEISLILNGDARSFSRQQMENISGYYARTIEAMAYEPCENIVSHSPLSDQERAQLLFEWNATKAESPREESICQLFEAQARCMPEAIAIVCADKQMTYQELNRRANQLGRRLRSLGVGPEVRVGICAQRSIGLIAGLLGILKAGGAYVPLDLAYPKERFAFMLEDAQVDVLVTDQQAIKSIPRHQSAVVRLDSDWESIGLEDDRNLATGIAANNLAYVIYTSGSTGRPKGVAIEHRSALTFLRWASTVFGSEELAGVVASTSICFDLSVFEIFAPLSYGGKVFIVENALDLATLGEEKDARLINTVPSAMAELANLNAVPRSVRTVNLAGEALRNKLVQQVYEQPAIERVFNLYGPSEDTTYSTFALMKRGESEEPLIGRPIANTQVYVVDEWHQPVPVAAAGELLIGGDGLARCYLNRPEMTAEKFIPDQFKNEPGARLYRTGDMARFLPDGNLDYLGRIDHQVKIRGFRIELGEIEAALAAHPSVREAVAMACVDSSGEKRIVAYLSFNQRPSGINELRAFLKERLPDYMVPSTFMILDSLPLTPNGKIDRRALKALDQPAAESEKVFTAPRDLLEFKLAQIWESILNRRPISITDNFFDLGGHSLLAVRLVAQIKDKLKYNLPLSALVETADIEKLAHRLRQQASHESDSILVALQPNGSRRPFFCIHPIGGNVLCYMDLARSSGPDRPFYGLQAIGLNEREIRFLRIEDMAARYIEAIRAAQPAGPYLLGGWSFGGVVAFEMARQLKQKSDQASQVVLLDTWAPNLNLKPDERDFSPSDLIGRFLTDIAGISGKELLIDHDDFQSLNTHDQLRRILEQARAQNILPADTDVAQLSRLFDVFERNARAFQAYLPSRLKLGNKVVLFRAAEGKNGAGADPATGWNEILVDELEVIDTSGNHYSMLSSVNAAALAEQLKAYLENVDS